MNKLRHRLLSALLPAVCLPVLLATVRPAPAQVDPWEFEVYSYSTLSRGTFELEINNAVVANGHSDGGDGTARGTFKSQGMWYNQYEFTYGFTDRVEAAAYLELAHPSSSQLWYAGSKYRVRGRLLDEGELPLDLAYKQSLLEMRNEEERRSNLQTALESKVGELAGLARARRVAGGNGHRKM